MKIEKTQMKVDNCIVFKESVNNDIMYYPYNSFTETAVMQLVEKIMTDVKDIKDDIKIIFNIGDFQADTIVKKSTNVMEKIYKSLPSTCEIINIFVIDKQLIIDVLV